MEAALSLCRLWTCDVLPASDGGWHLLPHWAASVACFPPVSTSPGCRAITLSSDPSVGQPILWEIEDEDLLQVGYAGTLTFEVKPHPAANLGVLLGASPLPS